MNLSEITFVRLFNWTKISDFYCQKNIIQENTRIDFWFFQGRTVKEVKEMLDCPSSTEPKEDKLGQGRVSL